MRSWLIVVLMAAGVLIPLPARAQAPIKLSSVQVHLRPEYDQRSMLVITDFTLAAGIAPPLTISLSFPSAATLFAVASQAPDGSFLTADYGGPSAIDAWQTIEVQVQSAVPYHFEYYQPMAFTGAQREFTYVWPGDHAVDDLRVDILVPPGASDVRTVPQAEVTTASDGTEQLQIALGALEAGQSPSVKLDYTKTTTDLTVPRQDLQPSQPLGADTPGRVMLSNYLPYILGMLGLALIVGGSVYFWQTSRGRTFARVRRHRRASERGQRESGSEVYCHQCGTRAQSGDRFCRVCGTRLRQAE